MESWFSRKEEIVNKLSFALILSIFLFLLLPTAVIAATNPDALAGLVEYFTFLLELARKGLEALVAYFQTLG